MMVTSSSNHIHKYMLIACIYLQMHVHRYLYLPVFIFLWMYKQWLQQKFEKDKAEHIMSLSHVVLFSY